MNILPAKPQVVCRFVPLRGAPAAVRKIINIAGAFFNSVCEVIDIMNMNRKIIIIRGPAGSGKSTITKLLLEELKEQSNKFKGSDEEDNHRFAYLEQDHFRNTIAGKYRGCRELSARLLLENAKACVECGYHVVMEGILNKQHYGESLFDPLIALYGEVNVKFFYLDASLALTQERHLTRSKADEFGVEKLEEWFASASPTQYGSEIVIPAAEYSAKDIVEMIVKVI